MTCSAGEKAAQVILLAAESENHGGVDNEYAKQVENLDGALERRNRCLTGKLERLCSEVAEINLHSGASNG
jgi:hypothetical protein